MEKNLSLQNIDKSKLKSISNDSYLKKIKLNAVRKVINQNNKNLQKNTLFNNRNNKLNIGNFNSYLHSLKKNQSYVSIKKSNLPILNSNNNTNSTNISTNKKISFSRINKTSALNRPLLNQLETSNSVKKLNQQPIKVQFFSKIRSMNTNKKNINSNVFRSLVSPNNTSLRNGNNLIFNTPISMSKEQTNEDLNKSDNVKSNTSSIEKSHIKRRIKFKPFGFSEFFKLSKNSDVSARNIYEHYILEEMKDETPDIQSNFTKYILKKFKDPKQKLNELYGINDENTRRIKELKSNNALALKDDFNVKEYQTILCGMIKKRCTNDSIIFLRKKFEKFNDEMKYFKRNFKYKGRYSKLADKIRKNAPSYLINRLKQLDEENLISKAKYFNVDLSNNPEQDL